MSSHQPVEQLNLKLEKKGLSPKQKGGIILSALALAGALGGGGCAAKTPEIKSPVTTEAPAEPAEVIEKAPEDPTEKYVDGLEAYKEMSVENFEKLPREERLKYAQFLIDQTVGRGNYENSYGSGTETRPSSIVPTEVSIDNTGQEIIDNNIYANQIAFLQFVESDLTSENKKFDKLDGMKMLSYAYYDVNGGEALLSDRYLKSKEIMSSMDVPTLLKKEARNVEETSSLINGVSSITGENVRYKDVTYKVEDGSSRLARFIYCEFDSYNGEREAVWLLETISVDSVDLDNNSYIEIVE